jgi:hypothetical protein
MDFDIWFDKIQDTKVGIPGWGAGPIPGRETLDDIEAIIKDNPMFQNIKDIEIRVQQVKLRTGPWKKGEQRTNAIHFFVREEDSSEARKLLNKLYPSKPQQEYPAGIPWRFVSNVSDPYFPKTPNSMRKAKSLRLKQGQFLKEVDKTFSNAIRNLHWRLPVAPYVTLAEIVMNWRSAKNQKDRLFLFVEQTYDHTEFVHHARVAREASALVPLLPLVLEQQFGPRAWGWFNENAKIYTQGYQYNIDEHQVTMVQDDTNAEVDENWDQGMGDFEFSDDEEEEEGNSGFVINIGNIVLQADDDRQRILDDESVGTMRSSAEAWKSTPAGWNDDDSSEMAVDVTKESLSTQSTLTSTTRGQNPNYDTMTPQQMRDAMTKLTEKLKTIETASPSKEDSGGE